MGLESLIAPGVGTAIGLAGSIYGGVKAGRERKKMDRYLSGLETENASFFNKNYYQDYTERDDIQALIANMRETMKERSNIAQSTAAITGATPEAVLAEKDSQNKAMTETYRNANIMGQANKDKIMDRYLGRKDMLSQMTYGNMDATAQSYENVMTNSMGSMVKSISSGIGALMNKKK
jgi:hypothetical protein